MQISAYIVLSNSKTMPRSSLKLPLETLKNSTIQYNGFSIANLDTNNCHRIFRMRLSMIHLKRLKMGFERDLITKCG